MLQTCVTSERLLNEWAPLHYKPVLSHLHGGPVLQTQFSDSHLLQNSYLASTPGLAQPSLAY